MSLSGAPSVDETQAHFVQSLHGLVGDHLLLSPSSISFVQLHKMDTADEVKDGRENPSDGILPSCDSGQTDIVPEEYYENRLGDLALYIPVSFQVRAKVGRTD